MLNTFEDKLTNKFLHLHACNSLNTSVLTKYENKNLLILYVTVFLEFCESGINLYGMDIHGFEYQNRQFNERLIIFLINRQADGIIIFYLTFGTH